MILLPFTNSFLLLPRGKWRKWKEDRNYAWGRIVLDETTVYIEKKKIFIYYTYTIHT